MVGHVVILCDSWLDLDLFTTKRASTGTMQTCAPATSPCLPLTGDLQIPPIHTRGTPMLMHPQIGLATSNLLLQPRSVSLYHRHRGSCMPPAVRHGAVLLLPAGFAPNCCDAISTINSACCRIYHAIECPRVVKTKPRTQILMPTNLASRLASMSTLSTYDYKGSCAPPRPVGRALLLLPAGFAPSCCDAISTSDSACCRNRFRTSPDSPAVVINSSASTAFTTSTDREKGESSRDPASMHVHSTAMATSQPKSQW